MKAVFGLEAPGWRASCSMGLPISGAIGTARLICILGIVYVHGWTGLPGSDLAARDETTQGIMRWAVIELCGRSAVPLLSLISGWLVVRSARQRRYGAFVAGKLRVIALPMLAWNMIALILVIGAARLGWIAAPQPSTMASLLNELVSLSGPAEIDVQMGFLRDLFLCMLLAPLLVRMPTVILLAVMALAMAWDIGGWASVILLRPAILLFFVGGMLAARYRVAEQVGAMPVSLAVLPFLLVLPFKLGLSIAGGALVVEESHLVALIDLMLRVAAAILVWRVSILIAMKSEGAWMRALEPYVFLLFCSHVLFMWLLGPMIGRLTGPMGSAAWPAYFVVQPLLALGFAILLGVTIAALSPALARVLSGGRLGRVSRL
jgi:hypothetical protein